MESFNVLTQWATYASYDPLQLSSDDFERLIIYTIDESRKQRLSDATLQFITDVCILHAKESEIARDLTVDMLLRLCFSETLPLNQLHTIAGLIHKIHPDSTFLQNHGSGIIRAMYNIQKSKILM